MNIIDRPIWDEERGLMTIEEHDSYMYDYADKKEQEERERVVAGRVTRGVFNYEDLQVVLNDEQKRQPPPRHYSRRIEHALARSCCEYWPKELINSGYSGGSWATDYRIPEDGGSQPEVLRLLVACSLRTRNTKAAVRDYLRCPQAFLEREERRLVRKRLAQ